MISHKKSLLGFICLIAVVIMTVIAFFIPTNTAEAVSRVDTLTVTVYDGIPATNIISPQDDIAVALMPINVDFTFEKAEYVDF